MLKTIYIKRILFTRKLLKKKINSQTEKTLNSPNNFEHNLLNDIWKRLCFYTDVIICNNNLYNNTVGFVAQCDYSISSDLFVQKKKN